MYALTELLVGGDDGGQDTAVYDELHEDLLVFHVQILAHNLPYFRFVFNLCSLSELHIWVDTQNSDEDKQKYID